MIENQDNLLSCKIQKINLRLLLYPTPLLTAHCYLDGRGGGCSINSGDPLCVLRTRSVSVILGHTRRAQAQERQRLSAESKVSAESIGSFKRLLDESMDRDDRWDG